jgi:hypothetical protein
MSVLTVATALGADAALVKPFGGDELAAVIRHVVGAGSGGARPLCSTTLR